MLSDLSVDGDARARQVRLRNLSADLPTDLRQPEAEA